MQWKTRAEGYKASKFFFELSHGYCGLDTTTEP